MMMISDRLSVVRRRRASRIVRVLVVVGVVAVLAAAYYARGPLAGALWQVLTPVIAVRNALGTSEATTLRAQLAALNAQVADRDALYQQNLELKAALNRAAGRSVTLAAIVSRPPMTPYDTLMIDRGEQDGVMVGSLVSVGGSSLVGTVTDVYATTARVTLYSAPGSVHHGTLMVGDKALSVSIEGQGGGSMRAQLPTGSGAKPGNVVTIPAIGMGLMAQVTHVHKREGESFETIYFALPADLNTRFVEIWQ